MYSSNNASECYGWEKKTNKLTMNEYFSQDLLALGNQFLEPFVLKK